MNEQNSSTNPKDIYIRTMKEDIEKLQKGLPPEPEAKTMEPPPNIPSASEEMPQYEKPKFAEIPKPQTTEMPTMPEIEIPEQKKLNLPLILEISGIVIVLIIGGIATYFLLFKKPTAITEQPIEEEQFLPTQIEEQPTEEEEQIPPTQIEEAQPEIPEPTIPKAFILTDFTQTVNLISKDKSELESVFKNIISSPKEFAKINNILLKIDTQTEKSYLSLKNIFETLNLGPIEFLNQLENESQLIGYTQDGEQKLGFIVKIKDANSMKSIMLAWENKMLNDLALNFLNRDPKTLKPATKTFQNNTYLDINIRYLNLPTPNITLDYAVVPEKNLLLFATSKNSMYKLVELLTRGY